MQTAAGVAALAEDPSTSSPGCSRLPADPLARGVTWMSAPLSHQSHCWCRFTPCSRFWLAPRTGEGKGARRSWCSSVRLHNAIGEKMRAGGVLARESWHVALIALPQRAAASGCLLPGNQGWNELSPNNTAEPHPASPGTPVQEY